MSRYAQLFVVMLVCSVLVWLLPVDGPHDHNQLANCLYQLGNVVSDTHYMMDNDNGRNAVIQLAAGIMIVIAAISMVRLGKKPKQKKSR